MQFKVVFKELFDLGKYKYRGVNFSENSDIKLLYNKAKDIETQLIKIDYTGKSSNVSRLIEITEKLDKIHESAVAKKFIYTKR